ncbi:MAG: TIGR03088 family PEP-CTERM/XrtA system glycosyltransferase [Kiloniellaceae bacterium]
MPRPLTICHIILKLDFGGLENGLTTLINNLPAERYNHIVVCLKEATSFRNRIRRTDVPIYEINKREGKDLFVYRKVWRLLRRLRPDIVQTRNLPTVDMLGPAALARVPALVHSEHGLDMTEIAGRHRRYRTLRRLSQLVVDRYIAVSNDLAHWMDSEVGIPRDRISVVYNGVDNETFRPRSGPSADRDGVLPAGFAPPSAFVVGTVGRLETVKDQTNLVRAFVHALERRPALRNTLRLVVIGDGSLRAEMEALLEDAGAAALAWTPGFRNDIADLYRTFDLFALPSRREGTSNTILEAMASGLPVVATNVGGNPELVVPEVSGRLVPAEQPWALAEAILDYVDQPSVAAEHGRAGRARILRDFSIEAMVRGYGAVYDAVARGHNRRSAP